MHQSVNCLMKEDHLEVYGLVLEIIINHMTYSMYNIMPKTKEPVVLAIKAMGKSLVLWCHVKNPYVSIILCSQRQSGYLGRMQTMHKDGMNVCMIGSYCCTSPDYRNPCSKAYLDNYVDSDMILWVHS